MLNWLHFSSVQFSSVQSLSRIQLFATPWTVACQVFLSTTNSRSLLKLISIELVMPSSHLILCHLSSPLTFNLSQHQGVFKWVSSSHQVAKRVSASTSILPRNTQDWSPLGWTGWISLQSKGLLRLFLNPQFKSIIVLHSAFFIVQLLPSIHDC